VPKKYRVTLTQEDRHQLQELISRGRGAARTLTRARVLLKADESESGPAWSNAAIQAALDVSEPLICRVRQRYVTGGLPAALHRKEQTHRKPRKLDGAQEAHLIALVCGEPPAGRDHWSLRLLAEKFVELGHVEELSHETVRRVLKKGI
jgi:hypothetical protein